MIAVLVCPVRSRSDALMSLFGLHKQVRDPSVEQLLHQQEQQIASLRQEISQLREHLAHSDTQAQTLQTDNARLRQENAHLREEIARLQRTGKRQAAPFSREQPNPHPNPPGRKPGEGPFTYRAAPAPESFTE